MCPAILSNSNCAKCAHATCVVCFLCLCISRYSISFRRSNKTIRVRVRIRLRRLCLLRVLLAGFFSCRGNDVYLELSAARWTFINSLSRAEISQREFVSERDTRREEVTRRIGENEDEEKSSQYVELIEFLNSKYTTRFAPFVPPRFLKPLKSLLRVVKINCRLVRTSDGEKSYSLTKRFRRGLNTIFFPTLATETKDLKNYTRYESDTLRKSEGNYCKERGNRE